MSVLITDIQRTCLHDGPGIRTTVFFKGCSLHCPWCANPETIFFQKEYYYDESLCVKNNNTCICNEKCPILRGGSIVNFNCPIHAINIFGVQYSSRDLYDEIILDLPFFRDSGGVTFSGGEPLLQLHRIRDLLRRLINAKIHICVETSLFVPDFFLKSVFEYINIFYVDLKILSSEECKNLLGGDIKVFYNNLEILFLQKVDMIFRIPLVNELTSSQQNIDLICNVIQRYRPLKVECFNVHQLAEKKYKLLKKTMPRFIPPSEDVAKKIKKVCVEANIPFIFMKM
ncbi:glycyl-radical enzyme activating protein [Breznakiella homolactica]|uniref:Glycyl-radical enzyme activating protein n=1 Tax=Breznakiella homolactica TaxID=2798577 RepID=A0A7T8BBA3_9SPIR|nr:glycyl-radical enzyme activating protein [Breznakiella homolactica]QQO09830.1 glycyl-radical enzyme activating protein [Breznakiella homolactica]